MVTEEAVHRLGLARDEWVGTTMRGVGGIESRPNADPRSLALGGVALVRRTLNHDTSLTVGVLPRTRVGNLVIDGVLGRDFLSLFDLDLDVPGRRLTLYQVRDCAGRFLPWQGEYAAVPVTLPDENALVVPVTLDATPLRAMLDTGASSSLVAAPGMFRLGLQAASFAGDPGRSGRWAGTAHGDDASARVPLASRGRRDGELAGDLGRAGSPDADRRYAAGRGLAGRAADMDFVRDTPVVCRHAVVAKRIGFCPDPCLSCAFAGSVATRLFSQGALQASTGVQSASLGCRRSIVSTQSGRRARRGSLAESHDRNGIASLSAR